MSTEKQSNSEFTLEEQRKIEEEVQKYNERVRQAAVECEIRTRIAEMERQASGNGYM